VVECLAAQLGNEAVTKRVWIPRTTTPLPLGGHDPCARRPRAVPDRPDVYLVRVLVLLEIGTAEVVELIEGNDVTILGHLYRLIGCRYIDLVQLVPDLHLWVDEEGLLVAEPVLVNRAASLLGAFASCRTLRGRRGKRRAGQNHGPVGRPARLVDRSARRARGVACFTGAPEVGGVTAE
jgi:hypothetical protein